MEEIERANLLVNEMLETDRIDSFNPQEFRLPLKIGVDLGTSNIVITVLDAADRPLAYALEPATVVRDGIVVDYLNATRILSRLKAALEERLGVALPEAATAIPPGILPGNVKVITNVAAAAGFEVLRVVDEPEAAALAMGIRDGAVVDIGGGTTGVSLIREGVVSYSVDEPTGGAHMTLVVAGNLGTDFVSAEYFKVNPQNYSQVFPMIRPVIEKMAQITRQSLREPVEAIYLAGGASCLPGIDGVFESYTGIPTRKPDNPLLITPIGIAMSVPLRR